MIKEGLSFYKERKRERKERRKKAKKGTGNLTNLPINQKPKVIGM